MTAATTALVLAAGMSTRIAAIAGELPKPLVPIAGEAVLTRNIRWLVSQNVTDLWINLHHRADQIAARVGDGSSLGAHVRYSREERLLGTAGAVSKLRDEWRGPFWIVYGDNLLSFSLPPMQEQHERSGALLTIAVFNIDEQISTGIAGGRVVVDGRGSVSGFTEGGAATSPFVNAGVYLTDPRILDWIPATGSSDFGHDVFPRLVAEKGAVQAHVIDGYCLGFDTPAAHARLNALIASGEVALA